jgi:hypothetical protein
MNKILLNIDSKYRNYDKFPFSCDFTLNLDNIIKSYNIKYIKLNHINISNNYSFFNKVRNNNYFKIKGIFVGPPPGPNVFHLPVDEIIIIISEYKYNIVNLINNINLQLNKNKFNEYIDNTIIKGIYFVLIDNKISIINLSKHYNCQIIFNNDDNIKYSSLGYCLGFRKENYLIEIDNKIYSELPFNIDGDDYLFLKINNYNNIIMNNKSENGAFAKINYNKSLNFILNTTFEYIYYFTEITNINILQFQILDYNGNNLYLYDDYSLILELGLENNSLEPKIYSDSKSTLPSQEIKLNSSTSDVVIYEKLNTILENISENNESIKSLNFDESNIDSDQILNEKKKKIKKIFDFSY